MDLLEKAHELGVDKWTVADFVLGVESLRQQLAECEREREKQIKACNEFWGKKSDADYGEIQRLAAERDELVADAKRYRYIRAEIGFRNGWIAISSWDTTQWESFRTGDDLDSAIDAALAKLGADKTGEVG